MTVAFATCFDNSVAAGGFLSSMSAPGELIQLEPGPFRAKVEVQRVQGIGKLVFVCNRKVLCTGLKPSDKVVFSYCVLPGLNGSDRVVGKGIEYAPTTLAGFGDDQEAHCVLPAGTKIVYYSLPKQSFLDRVSRGGDDRFLELRAQRNHLELSLKSFSVFCSGLDVFFSLNPSSGSEFRLDVMLDLLYIGSSAAPVSPSSRALVAHSFVRWCHSNVFRVPPSLDLIAAALFVSRRSLIQAVKEAFGCGPAEIYKSIRLQYCHHILTGGDVSSWPLDAPGPVSVGEAMNALGFKHRGSFAKSFRDFFGVSPGELGCLPVL